METTQILQKIPKFNRDLISKTVAYGASAEQLDYFMYLAEEYNLDPLKKEIFWGQKDGKVTIITSRDGYLKHANSHEAFNGLESDTVYENDTLTRREDASIHIVYGYDHINFTKGKLRGAFCNIYRKDRDKACATFVSFDDYKRDITIWKSYPHAMIVKVAESMALKRAFAISGLVAKEEVEDK